ncbi:MAG: hypothetical protein ACK4TA_00165 [Saprospiraceae bacterium]
MNKQQETDWKLRFHYGVIDEVKAFFGLSEDLTPAEVHHFMIEQNKAKGTMVPRASAPAAPVTKVTTPAPKVEPKKEEIPATQAWRMSAFNQRLEKKFRGQK